LKVEAFLYFTGNQAPALCLASLIREMRLKLRLNSFSKSLSISLSQGGV
jgi:hypothetical protein